MHRKGKELSEMVTVMDMANAREARSLRQKAMLQKHGAPLISFTMNIAGPVKTTPLILAGFELGRARILHRLSAMGVKPLESALTDRETGCELLLCARADAAALKSAMTRLEEEEPIGRLWDIDVLDATGVKLDRARLRRCLMCDTPAPICARSRAHSSGELFERAELMLREFFEIEAARGAAELAVRAVLYELLVTPKPGLVDRANSGAHRDMDAFTFAASAAALFPYFEKCARLGVELKSQAGLFADLRGAGLEAERRMLEATGGVNTHKGAIFSMGILCAACGLLLGKGISASPQALSEACVLLAGETLERELKEIKEQSAHTAGRAMYRETGMTGARGEAARGFPTAVCALDILREALRNGKSINDAGVEALMHILTQAQDSNFVKRSSAKRREEWIRRISGMRGGDAVAMAALLDGEFITENISPGGCADLLAATLFMHFAQGLRPVPPLSAPISGDTAL